MHQGHDILELIAESESAARLIERRTAPDPAAQHLVQEPAIEEQVDTRVGRAHLHGVQNSVPALADFFECRLHLCRVPVATQQTSRFVLAGSLQRMAQVDHGATELRLVLQGYAVAIRGRLIVAPSSALATRALNVNKKRDYRRPFRALTFGLALLRAGLRALGTRRVACPAGGPL